MDYHPLPPNGWKLPDTEPEPEEEQAAPEPVVVDLVYNAYEERNGKTIALKISLRLPLNS
jgi:hypothetical protein